MTFSEFMGLSLQFTICFAAHVALPGNRPPANYGFALLLAAGEANSPNIAALAKYLFCCSMGGDRMVRSSAENRSKHLSARWETL
jgi:hypothetical protein